MNDAVVSLVGGSVYKALRERCPFSSYVKVLPWTADRHHGAGHAWFTGPTWTLKRPVFALCELSCYGG